MPFSQVTNCSSLLRASELLVACTPPGKLWTQIDLSTISCKGRTVYKTASSAGALPSNANKTVICSRLSESSGSSKGVFQPRLDWCNLSDSIRPLIFQSILAEKVEFSPNSNTNDHWSPINSAPHSVGLVSCGLTHRIGTPRISSESLRFLDARQYIQAGSEHSEARPLGRRELSAGLHKDREI